MVAIPCICAPDGSRHPSGDTVTLRDKLDFTSSLAARNTIIHAKTNDPGMSVGEVQALLTELYLLSGIESWTVRDEKGKPLEPTRTNIRDILFANIEAAMLVADAADEQYAEAVMLPLLAKASTSSPPTPEAPSTSLTTGSSPEPRKRSKRSSTSTTPTDDIEVTSPLLVGVSSSSPSSATAA
jgi:hypothetical protein